MDELKCPSFFFQPPNIKRLTEEEEKNKVEEAKVFKLGRLNTEKENESCEDDEDGGDDDNEEDDEDGGDDDNEEDDEDGDEQNGESLLVTNEVDAAEKRRKKKEEREKEERRKAQVDDEREKYMFNGNCCLYVI